MTKLRNSQTRPRRLRSLTERLIPQESAIELNILLPVLHNRQKILALFSVTHIMLAAGTTHTSRLQHTLPPLQNLRPLLPRQHSLSIPPSKLCDDEIPHCPRRNRNINQRDILPEEVRAAFFPSS